MRTLIALSLCLVGCSQMYANTETKVEKVTPFVSRFETDDAVCYYDGRGLSCIAKRTECK